MPDAEVLEEMEVQADQRSAPPTLGAVSDALLTVAEAVAGNFLTSTVAASYPALGRYVDRVKEVLHRPRRLPVENASAESGRARAEQQAPEGARPSAQARQPAPEPAQRTRIALKAAVGDPAGEPGPHRDSETNAFKARIETTGGPWSRCAWSRRHG